MNILGISAFYHDSAATLVRDGAIVAAAQEERFTRRKQDPSFPSKAMAYCLHAGGIEASDLDVVVFYEKPLLKAERLLETYLGVVPRGLGSYSGPNTKGRFSSPSIMSPMPPAPSSRHPSRTPRS
jgi:carbamoyltransferase